MTRRVLIGGSGLTASAVMALARAGFEIVDATCGYTATNVTLPSPTAINTNIGLPPYVSKPKEKAQWKRETAGRRRR